MKTQKMNPRLTRSSPLASTSSQQEELHSDTHKANKPRNKILITWCRENDVDSECPKSKQEKKAQVD